LANRSASCAGVTYNGQIMGMLVKL